MPTHYLSNGTIKPAPGMELASGMATTVPSTIMRPKTTKDEAAIDRSYKLVVPVPRGEAFEQMISGMYFDPTDPILVEHRLAIHTALHAYNHDLPTLTTISATMLAAYRTDRLLKLLGAIDATSTIAPLFHLAFGCNVFISPHVTADPGLTLHDSAPIHIGPHCLLGPHVSLLTETRPFDPALRRDGRAFALPITLAANVWIQAGATIMPGVTVGEGSVVLPGAVVRGDVPPFCVVEGNPARVVGRLARETEVRMSRRESLLKGSEAVSALPPVGMSADHVGAPHSQDAAAASVGVGVWMKPGASVRSGGKQGRGKLHRALSGFFLKSEGGVKREGSGLRRELSGERMGGGGAEERRNDKVVPDVVGGGERMPVAASIVAMGQERVRAEKQGLTREEAHAAVSASDDKAVDVKKQKKKPDLKEMEAKAQRVKSMPMMYKTFLCNALAGQGGK